MGVTSLCLVSKSHEEVFNKTKNNNERDTNFKVSSLAQILKKPLKVELKSTFFDVKILTIIQVNFMFFKQVFFL